MRSSTNKIYAGIGSRETPGRALEYMTYLACRLESGGYDLRSGGAKGADQAFETGTARVEVFDSNDATTESIAMASQYHPAWNRCSAYAQRLHGRNCMIILGRHLNTPVDFVVCWADPQKKRGGTRLGMRVAEDHGIDVFNLYEEGTASVLEDFLSRHVPDWKWDPNSF
jgi:hypothetical protein